MAKEITLDDETEERDAEVEAAFAELSSNGAVRWMIYCTGPKDKIGHCATWEDGMSLDRIAREFGAGSYRIRAIGDDAKMIKGGARTIVISSNSAFEREKKKAEKAELAAVPVPQRPDMSVADIIGLITAQQSQSQAALQAQQSQMMQMMQLTMKSQGDFMMAMMSKPTQSLGAPEIISMMSGIRDMVKPEGSGVDTLLKGLELGRSLDGGGGGDGMDFLSVAAKGLDVISSAVKANPRPQPLPPNRPRRVQVTQTDKPLHPPAPKAPKTDPPTQSVTPPIQEDPMLKKINWLKMQVAALLIQAQRQSDPALYAAVFLDNLPDIISETELKERFEADGAVDQLALLDGRVAKFKEWFEEFRTSVLEQMEDPGDDEDEEDDGQGTAFDDSAVNDAD